MYNQLNSYIHNSLDGVMFRSISNDRTFTTSNFFSDLYNSPPKIQVSWDNLSSTSLSTDADIDKKISKTKIKSASFSNKENNSVENVLQKVPIYLVQNGRGEMVTSNSSNQKLGLFFLSRMDAENYLREILTQDQRGSKTFGLCIHCVNLDYAYKVSREFGTDLNFRFVPNFQEIDTVINYRHFLKSLPNLNVFSGEGNGLSNNRVSQLDFKGSDIYPKFKSFTGVPIYTIPLEEIEEVSGVKSVTNFIFFELDEVKKFIIKYQKFGPSTNKIIPANSDLKVNILNLEDFLEEFEESLVSNYETSKTFFNNVRFIISDVKVKDSNQISDTSTKPFLKNLEQLLIFKSKRLNGFIEGFINSN